jgi:hypothetical protein
MATMYVSHVHVHGEPRTGGSVGKSGETEKHQFPANRYLHTHMHLTEHMLREEQSVITARLPILMESPPYAAKTRGRYRHDRFTQIDCAT